MIWANKLKRKVENTKCILMIPFADLIELLDGVALGVAQLTDEQWAENLKLQGQSLAQHEGMKRSESYVKKFETNAELSEWLVSTSEAWLVKQH